MNIPATGYPDDAAPAQIIVGLKLCDEHAKEFDAKAFLLSDPRLIQAITLLTRGMAPPDFARAFSRPVPFNSRAWKGLSQS